jgi:Ca-activated chloride channel family protein
MCVPAVALLVCQLVLSVHTELVAVPVTVTDGQGHRVSGLSQENFRVLDSGRPQPIAVFHHGDAPITLGLVVDRSQSMRAKHAAFLAAVSVLLRSSRPDDELFGVTFNDRVSLTPADGEPFTNDPKGLEASLAEVRAEGRTALYDAVAEGLQRLQAGRAGKRALVVVSDGGDNASRQTYDRILSLARKSDAVIYTLGLLGTSTAEEEEDAGLVVRLCKDTGGIAFFPRTVEEIDTMAAQIAGDIRQQYTLGFVPGERGDPGAFRKIEVTVTVTGQGHLKVRTRSGYLAAGSPVEKKDEHTP